MNDSAKQMVLFFSALAVRIPFLFAGYGVEEDSWGHVLQSALMDETGVYDISRLPGHPLYEALLLILWNVHSPFLFNLPSALAGAGAITVFYRIGKSYNLPMVYWWSLALGFVPVFFISSTYTIDYSITLFFSLLSFEAALNNKPERAGIWLAVATGFRITALGMLLPIGYFLLRDKSWDVSIALRLRKAIKLILISTFLSAVFYIPPFSNYGWQFFDFHKPPYPSVLEAFYKMSIGVWGVMGVLSLLLVIGFLLIKRKRFRWQLHHTVWVMVAVLYAFSYFKMPEKSAFWLPVVPFVLFFMAEQSNRKQSFILGGLLIAAPLLFGINKTDKHTGSSHSKIAITFGSSNGELFLDPINGPILNDLSKRNNKMAACEKLEYQLMIQRQRTLVIAGWWYAMLEVDRRDGKWSNANIELVYYASPEDMRSYQQRGYQLRYLPEQAAVNDQKYNTDFTVNNATQMSFE